MRTLTIVCRGLGAGLRARAGSAAAAAIVVLALEILAPALVLSLARTPWTYFTFNPWLKRLPEYLGGNTPLDQKLDFLSGVALFWFTADGAYGAPEWGFAVDAMDLGRFVLVAILGGVYVALWRHRRDLRRSAARRTTVHGGGAIAVLAGVLGFSTGPCSVVGCGAPVLPVVALAFAGLSSGTLTLLSGLSHVTALLTVAVLTGSIAYLGWRVGAARHLGAL